MKKKKLDVSRLLYGLGTVFIVVGVMMYAFATADVVPDNIPFFGFIDDAGVLILAFLLYQRIKSRIKKFGKR